MRLVEAISRELAIPEFRLLAIASASSHLYKTYYIEKKNGGRREISQPSRVLKAVQRSAVKNFLSLVPCHDAAVAYRPGIGLLSAATPHSHSKFVLKLDIESFFPSITVKVLENCFREVTRRVGRDFGHVRLARTDEIFLLKLLTKSGRLTIGAPSSPITSNLVMYKFDCEVDMFCKEREVVFNRYADDMYFSSKNLDGLDAVEELVQDKLKSCVSRSFFLNTEKTGRFGTGDGLRVLGLSLDGNGGVSIGRGRKRQIRTLVFLYSKGDLEWDEAMRLRGLLAFASSIEPEFVESVKDKYGQDLVGRIMRDKELMSVPDIEEYRFQQDV